MQVLRAYLHDALRVEGVAGPGFSKVRRASGERLAFQGLLKSMLKLFTRI